LIFLPSKQKKTFMNTNLLYVFIFIALISCKLDKSFNPLPDISFVEAEMQKNQGRSSWQKPNLIINKLGDISQKTVADIGAGTGFFSFRLGMKAKKVISVDIDSSMVSLIELQKENLPLEISAKIETRLVKPNDSGLEKGEADIIVIVNTITFIENPFEYLKKLYDICEVGNELLVVDFKKIPVNMNAPPLEERFTASEVMNLIKSAGFTMTEVDEEILEYQYIILAKK
jgi:2-polyprenyl-3-methyl-5-hydroxy-6-metoxy-1,4-benzoquinol methylase